METIVTKIMIIVYDRRSVFFDNSLRCIATAFRLLYILYYKPPDDVANPDLVDKYTGRIKFIF